MSKISDVKDTMSKVSILLEGYRYELNQLQSILFRIHKKHGNLEIEVGDFPQEQINSFDFTWNANIEKGEVVSASLFGVERTFETTAQKLERQYLELIK